jgi:DnaK suppressor protein
MKTIILSEPREQLLKRLSELKVTQQKIKTEMIEAAESQTNFSLDSLDHSKEQSDLSALWEINEKYVNETRQILSALERIKKGSFGECIECGEMISARRLFARPSASHCLECQNQKEDLAGMDINLIKNVRSLNIFNNQSEVA